VQKKEHELENIASGEKEVISIEELMERF